MTVALDAAPAAAEHAGHTSAPSDEGCERPVVPDCCEALATCSMTLGGDEHRRIELVEAAGAPIVTTTERTPASRVAAPDPPPPRS